MKAAIALAFLAVLAPAQDRIAALRKGIVEEESNHNLPAAIQAYESLLKQADADRPTVATALFRLGECYRKLGKTEQAAAAYKRVVEQYPDQARLAEQSRRHLPNAKKSAAAESAEALRRYRALLEEEIKMAEEQVKRIRDSGNIPAVSGEAEKAQMQAMELRRELAALMPTCPSPGRLPRLPRPRPPRRAGSTRSACKRESRWQRPISTTRATKSSLGQSRRWKCTNRRDSLRRRSAKWSQSTPG